LVSDEPRIDAAALRHHVQVCPDCRAAASARATVRESVHAADDLIDDLTKARVLGRILDELEPVRPSAPSLRGRHGGFAFWRRPGRRARVVWSLVLAAACGVVLGVSLRGREDADRTAPVASARLALEPYASHFGGDVPTTLPGHGLDRLQLPAHAWMRARLGPSADLTLLGPLELTVRERQDLRVELALTRGALVGDFDGAGGRRLRICTGDATVEIVGTRFLVEANLGSTRVSVAHGRVRVESRGRVRMVDGGMSWSTEKDEAEPLPKAVAELFERATRGSWGDANGEPRESAPTDQRPGPPPHAAKEREAKHARLALRKVGVTHANARVMAPRAPKVSQDLGTNEAPPTTLTSSPGLSAASAEGAPVEVSPAVRPEGEAAPRPVAAASASRAPSVAAPAAGRASETAPSTAALRAHTPSDLYRRAEGALGRGDETQGKELLEALVSEFPHEEIVDSARFELALLAKKAGRSREALAETRAILGHGGTGPFVEPARFLRCRVYLGEDRDAAMSCLGRFVHDYPQSPHDAFALRALTELAEKSGNCARAAAHAAVYLQRHPDGDFAAEARGIRSRCGD